MPRQISAVARDLGLAGDPDPIPERARHPGRTEDGGGDAILAGGAQLHASHDTPDEAWSIPAVAGRRSGSSRWMNPARTMGARFTSLSGCRTSRPRHGWLPRWLPVGRMVRDTFAPAWWTLADAAGNEADIATTTGRD
jgi:hypothetical protein